jgi:hypothetical protein
MWDSYSLVWYWTGHFWLRENSLSQSPFYANARPFSFKGIKSRNIKGGVKRQEELVLGCTVIFDRVNQKEGRHWICDMKFNWCNSLNRFSIPPPGLWLFWLQDLLPELFWSPLLLSRKGSPPAVLPTLVCLCDLHRYHHPGVLGHSTDVTTAIGNSPTIIDIEPAIFSTAWRLFALSIARQEIKREFTPCAILEAMSSHNASLWCNRKTK